MDYSLCGRGCCVRSVGSVVALIDVSREHDGAAVVIGKVDAVVVDSLDSILVAEVPLTVAYLFENLCGVNMALTGKG